MDVTWWEGAEHGLVWEHGLAVVSAAVPVEAACRLWADFAEGGALAVFLKRLSDASGADLLSLPSFAVALRAEAGGWQLAARGALAVVVDDVVVQGAEVSTWTERRIGGGSSVLVGSRGGAAARPIVAGVVPAGGLVVDEHARVVVSAGTTGVAPVWQPPAAEQQVMRALGRGDRPAASRRAERARPE